MTAFAVPFFVAFVAWIVLVLWKLDWLMRHAVIAMLLMATVLGVTFVGAVEYHYNEWPYFTVGTPAAHERANTSFADLTALCGTNANPLPQTCPFSLTVETLPARNNDPTFTIVLRVENGSRLTALMQGGPPDEMGYRSSNCPGEWRRSTVLRPDSTLECSVTFDSAAYDAYISRHGIGYIAGVAIATRQKQSYWYRDEVTESFISLAAVVPQTPQIIDD